MKRLASNEEILDETDVIADGIDFSFDWTAAESPTKRPRLDLGPPTDGVTEIIRPLSLYDGWVIIVTQRFDRAARLKAGLPVNVETALALTETPAETYVCRLAGAEPLLGTWLMRLIEDLRNPSVTSPLFVALHWLCRPTWPKVPLVIPASLRGRGVNRGQWGYDQTRDVVSQFSLEVPNLLVTRLHVDTLVHLHAGLGDTIDLEETECDVLECPPTAPFLDIVSQPHSSRFVPLQFVPAHDDGPLSCLDG